MGTNSKIEWTNHTWNPWRGCTKVSPGCDNCYMMREVKRYGHNGCIVERHADGTFNAPITFSQKVGWKWADGSKVFVCSWSDFFHPDADGWRGAAWSIIRRRPGLIFQILTKRPERMAMCLPEDWGDGWPNVWLGVTAETQEMADKRIPILLSTPAAKRFVSIEPMLGPVDLRYLHHDDTVEIDALNGTHGVIRPHRGKNDKLDWIIVGGETGPGARPRRPAHGPGLGAVGARPVQGGRRSLFLQADDGESAHTARPHGAGGSGVKTIHAADLFCGTGKGE